jgi:hypothetical protein
VCYYQCEILYHREIEKSNITVINHFLTVFEGSNTITLMEKYSDLEASLILPDDGRYARPKRVVEDKWMGSV